MEAGECRREDSVVAAKDMPRLAIASLIGAALAFPAGMMVAGSRDEARPAVINRPADAAMRDMFSPSIRRDPWFLARQREGIEALESYCARTGESCPEARSARRRLAEIEAGN